MPCLDEATVLAFVAGRHTDEAWIDSHLGDCKPCRDLVVWAARSTLAPSLSIAATVDARVGASDEPRTPRRGPPPPPDAERYEIRDLLGFGGQGLVYLARDAVLGREVALKVLRPDAGGGERILDEARLIARLNHPNIVAIYDAGAAADGAIYLAMEYVTGGDLPGWLRGDPAPSRRDVLRVCIEAARGLAAAHMAGVVHRDVKPANVLIGGDGRARVGDFGLAVDHARIERGLAGTLAFMAPEQLDGEATAASDQWSLAATAWEALTGAPAFRGNTVDERRAVLRDGPGVPARPLPRHVVAALRRGLDHDPERRFPSIAELADALATDPTRRRRHAMLIAGGVAALAAGAWVAWPRDRAPSCGGLDAELAGVWDAAARTKVDNAFAASDLPFAGATRASVVRVLDDYAHAWIAARTRRCVAGGRGEQTAELRELAVQCLDERKDALAAAARTLAAADRPVIEHAIDLANGLPSLAPCDNAAWLRERVRPPTEAAARTAVAEVARQTADSQALLRAGKLADARKLADAAVAAAGKLDHAPTRARAYLALGLAQARTGDHVAAQTSFEQAAQEAQRGKDDASAAEAWVELVNVVGYGAGRYDDALRMAGYADATIARLGGDERLQAALAYYKCAVLDQEAKVDAAEASCNLARKLREDHHGPDDTLISNVLILQSRIAVKRERFDEAADDAARAIAIRERALGRDHPQLVEAYFTAGQVAGWQGKLDEAERDYARATELAHGTFGDDSPVMASLLAERSALAYRRGDLAGALDLIDRSTAVREVRYGTEHPDLVFNLLQRGRILDELGRTAESAAVLERARAIAEKALGPEHPTLVAVLEDLGRVHGRLHQDALARAELERAIAITRAGSDRGAEAAAASAYAEYLHAGGKPREAVPYYLEALATFETVYGKDNLQLYAPLQNLGLAYVQMGDPKRGLRYVDRAIAVAEIADGPESLRLLLLLDIRGDALFAARDYAGARAAWDRAVSLVGSEREYAERVAEIKKKLLRFPKLSLR